MISELFSLPKTKMATVFIPEYVKRNWIWGNYLVDEPKIYFLAKPMASITYLDHQYFIILKLST